MNADLLARIESKARRFFSASHGSHDWSHTERVAALCRHIGLIEKGDLAILEPAALLHDIARPIESESGGAICHAARGAEMARDILEEEGVPADTVQAITDCIASHRFRDQTEPATLEARILFDADKLDSIGGVGIARAFLFAGEVGATVHDPDVDCEATEPYSKDDTAYREFLVKLQHVKSRMLTSEGKRMAEERHIFMTEFFDRLNREVTGDI